MVNFKKKLAIDEAFVVLEQIELKHHKSRKACHKLEIQILGEFLAKENASDEALNELVLRELAAGGKEVLVAAVESRDVVLECLVGLKLDAVENVSAILPLREGY
jgi:hypothetical protein